MRWQWTIAPLSLGCRAEYSVERQTRVDVFEQNRLAAIDLLLVVDNSGSMREEQGHLAEAFDTLIGALESGNTEWRVAVTTTETSLEPWRASLEGAMDELVLEAADGARLDAVAWDDRTWAVGDDVGFSRCTADSWRVEATSRGVRNPCAGPPADGVDDGPRAPISGELLINEFVPRTSEPACGWVELWNPTAATLDLSDVVVRDDGRDAIALPDGTVLAPGDTLVWTSFPDCGAADVVDPALHLATGERWVDRDTPDGARVFSELVAVGDGSFGLEMGFENARLALEDPAWPATDAGFLREDADLAIVFVSDEDDLSPGSVADYVNGFRALKGAAGQREEGRVRLAVVAGIDPPATGSATSCDSDDGEAVWAPRYVTLAAVSGGPSWSICGDLDGIAESVGLTVSEQKLEFALSGIPLTSSLDVGLYASVEAEDRLQTLVRGEDYVLFSTDDEDGQQVVWMRFPDGLLPPGSVLIVEYEELPPSSRIDVTATTTPVTP
jgi:hypothetical protein